MVISDKKLKELLIQPGHISEVDFKMAQAEAEDQGKTIAQVLIDKSIIKDEQLGQLIAEELKIPFVNLRQQKFDESVLQLIPEVVARNKKVIAFAGENGSVKIATSNPGDLEIIRMLNKKLDRKVQIHYATERDMDEALINYNTNIKKEFNSIIKKIQSKHIPREEKDELFVKLVDKLFEHGYQSKASDIHIEPFAKKVLIRFRIDGVMHDIVEIPKALSEYLVSRVKIMAKLRTDEHRAAQDGKISFKIGEGKIDIRVSIVPITQGENLVMRLLASKSRQYSMNDLGFSAADYKKVMSAIKKPHGMILVTGPTGSGKTTTLYSVLKVLNKREVHISTIEDPVEFDIEGVSQIQVNSKTNLTFAKGLRAIVRQDPDIIMVGEIRDEETAGIAVNSALTGHLVLSTLHTNNAATTLPRLIDMKIEPFLVASTINIVVAQRLIRKICEKCRETRNLTDQEKEIIQNDIYLKKIFQKNNRYKNLDKAIIYKGVGCKVCNGTGYFGRIGIFEILLMEGAVKKLVLKSASSDEIMEIAVKKGMNTMLADGIDKVFNGITTLEEVLRVTRE